MSATPPGGSHWAKSVDEEDRVEKIIRNSGCWDQHIGVVDCMGEAADWRKCQAQLGEFRTCMTKAHADNKKRAEEAAKSN